MAHLPRLTLHRYLVGAIAEAVIVDLRENLFRMPVSQKFLPLLMVKVLTI